MTTLTKGLDVPISGSPEQHIEAAPPVTKVALLGDDYIGMKPTMLVSEGDVVRVGQPLFEDKKNPGVLFTSPAAGTVESVNRGAKRKFESVVVAIDGDDSIEFSEVAGKEASVLGSEKLVEQLVASGLWTALRTRPYGKVPAIDSTPRSIFVTAIDTNPLAADPSVAIDGRGDQFVLGLTVLAQLTDGKVHVCKSLDAEIPGGGVDGVDIHAFGGPHPAGLPGTHIHFIDPVGPGRMVWYINYQDVCMFGAFLQTGKVDTRRVVSLAGPVIKQPRLIDTQLGASVTQLIASQYDDATDIRPVSGSVLCGRHAVSPVDYLGRYHNQVSVLAEGHEREFLGWQKPGFDKYSTTKIYASAATPGKKFDMTTTTHGSERAMVPMGTYEKVMPMDILATQLLRSLIVHDTDEAQALGVLELEEEDLGLCTFVCPGKYDFTSLIRENLTTIEREG
ncbi:MAG: Na(+)-translocating NADH-quinone reductase subunit A [Planctomycetota bacterium]